ncbi:4395_t:CDS:1, partial [Acaulospora colombiana]
FILYRRFHQNHTFKDLKNQIDMRSLSIKIAEQWRNEPPDVKKQWHQLAEEEKLKKRYRATGDMPDGLK